MSTRPKTGVLLINLGTPDSTNVSDVRRYLAEFLSDPKVVDINPITRWLLLNLIILRVRPAKSAAAYREVWTDRGSPLLFHSQDLTAGVRDALEGTEVELAMRYGNPSIRAGLDSLRARGVDNVVVFPLFPQFATSSTGSAIAKVYEEAARVWNSPFITVVPPFFDDEGYVAAFAAVGAPVIKEIEPEHVLFSFHGLPERHMKKSDESGGQYCLVSNDCCAALNEKNRNCYRAQCFATARAITAALGVDDSGYSVAFQSRLGRDPWIKPYTDEVIVELAKAGTKRLVVFSPAFVADCLETIEEIGMRARDDFQSAGGEAFALVPSLNAHPDWVKAAAGLIRATSPSL